MADDNTGYKPLLQRMIPDSSLYNNEKAPNPQYNSPLSGFMGKISSAWQGGQDKFVPSPMDGSDEYEEYLSSGVSEDMNAREFARVFDPTSNTDVMKMQGMLGVKEDGILGPKTLSALKELQGVSPQPQASGEMEDEYGDMVSYGDSASTYDRDVNMANEPDAQSWIQSMDPSYMQRDNVAPTEFQGPNAEEVEMANENNVMRAMAALRSQEQPYNEEGLDEYDVDGNIVGGPDYKGPGSTNMNRFDAILRGMNPDLDRFTELDMNSDAPSTLSGVNSYDPRFMQTPSGSRNNLRALINQALNVTTRK